MTPSVRLRRLIELTFALKRGLHERLGRKRFRLDPATLPRLIVLRYARERGEPAMKEIAALLCVTPPSATVLIDGLVASGLLERRPDPADRRGVRLALTAKGRAFTDARFRAIEREMGKMFGRLTSQEQEQLIHLFAKLLL